MPTIADRYETLPRFLKLTYNTIYCDTKNKLR